VDQGQLKTQIIKLTLEGLEVVVAQMLEQVKEYLAKVLKEPKPQQILEDQKEPEAEQEERRLDLLAV
jgi:hypothetical protein